MQHGNGDDVLCCERMMSNHVYLPTFKETHPPPSHQAAHHANGVCPPPRLLLPLQAAHSEAPPSPPSLSRLLTMPNGERIQFDNNINFIFECHSLQFASPATVSRCGMTFLSDEAVDVDRMQTHDQRPE